MTDHPASWLSDPTGRHDHRYWDGTQWTDHVADAGVAATDPYDGPADATPDAPGGSTSSPTTSTSGWATAAPEEPASPAEEAPAAPAPSGWGTAAQPAGEAEPESPEQPDLFAPQAVSGWGTPTTSEPASADAPDEPAATDEPATTEPTSPWSTPATTSWSTPGTSAWGAPSTTDADADAEGDEVADTTAVTETPTATWGPPVAAAPSSTWDEAPTSVAPSTTWSTTTTGGPASGGGGSRKGLVLVLSLFAIVAIIVALVLVGDDDDVGGDEAAQKSAEIAEQLQEQGPVSDEDAKCVGDYVVDEIGASRLRGVDLNADTAPPELQDDFQAAIQDAFTECDVTLRPGSSEGGTAGAADSATPSEAPQMTEREYTDYYTRTLGLPQEKAECLAARSAEAVASGDTAQDEATTKFYEWLTECGISLEELQQSAANAEPSGTG